MKELSRLWSDDNSWEENEIWKEFAIVNILSYDAES